MAKTRNNYNRVKLCDDFKQNVNKGLLQICQALISIMLNINMNVPYLVIGNVEIGLEVSGHDEKSVQYCETHQVQSHCLKCLPSHQRFTHPFVQVDSEWIPGQWSDPQSCEEKRRDKPNVIENVGSGAVTCVSQHIPVHTRYTQTWKCEQCT